jgi:hypothetical protein
MVERLRAKPGGHEMRVDIGDMSRLRLDRAYALVYLVFNTIGNLLTQDGQVRCFGNAAAHLALDGVFVLECRVPTAPSRPARLVSHWRRFLTDPASYYRHLLAD